MASGTVQNKPVFFENLDALRALAFGMVFIYHFFPYVGYNPDTKIGSFIFDNLVLKGHLGVNLFFVLSGFLITYLLIFEKENTARIHLRFFYMRRILRIWPLYFIALIIGFFIYPILTGRYESASVNEHFSYYAFFISNFDRIRTSFVGVGNDNLGVLWSIAVEEQFYFFWPLILSVTNKKYYIHLFVFIIGFSITFRLMHVHDEPRLYLHTFSVMSDLVVGALLAYSCFYKTSLYYKLENCSKPFIVTVYIVLLLAVLFLFYWSTLNTFTVVIERLVLSLIFAFIIGEQCFARNSLFKLGRFKKLSSIGVISYGLYCFHLYSIVVVQKINHLLYAGNIIKPVFYCEMALSLTVCIFACYFSYHYFEKNILKLKSRFMPIYHSKNKSDAIGST